MQRIVFFTLATIAIAFACGTNEKTCNNGQCYNPTTTVCLQDVDKSYSLCPSGLQICNKACFNPSSYYCDSNGNLQSGQAPAAKTSAASKASTTSAAAKSTTKSTTSTTSSTTKAATTSAAAATPATSSAAAATPATSSSAVSSGSNVCAKASYCDPAACACNGACYSPSAYCCDAGTTLKQVGQCSNSGAASTSAAAASTTAAAANPATSSAASSGSNTCAKASYCDPAACACNGACYSPSAYCCDAGTTLKQAGQCSNSGAAPASSTTSSTTTSAAKVATTTATPVVNPTPVAGNGFPTQNADLRIINSCKTTLWLEARYGNQGAPLPGQSTTAVQALPGSYVDYTVPDTGLSGSRFWAKYGCDTNGKNCLIGDQMQVRFYFPSLFSFHIAKIVQKILRKICT